MILAFCFKKLDLEWFLLPSALSGGSWQESAVAGGGDHFAVLSHFVAFAETKTNKRKLAIITSEGSMFGKPFCLVQHSSDSNNFFIKVIFTPNSKRTNQESVAVYGSMYIVQYTYVCDAHGHRSNRIKVQLNKVLLQKILFAPCFLHSSLIQQTGCNVATSIHSLKQPARL